MNGMQVDVIEDYAGKILGFDLDLFILIEYTTVGCRFRLGQARLHQIWMSRRVTRYISSVCFCDVYNLVIICVLELMFLVIV